MHTTPLSPFGRSGNKHCSECRKQEYFQEKQERSNCHKDNSNKCTAKQGTSVTSFRFVTKFLVILAQQNFVCGATLSHQSGVLFLSIHHSIDLEKKNYLCLAGNRDAETSLLFFTIAHFPSFSQIEQKNQNQMHISFPERNISRAFFP